MAEILNIVSSLYQNIKYTFIQPFGFLASENSLEVNR